MDLLGRSHVLYRRAVWITALLPLPVLLLAANPASRSARLLAWAACYGLFLSFLVLAHRSRRAPVALALAQAAAALTAGGLLATTAEGAMLVVVATQWAARFSARVAIAIAAAQSLAFGWLIGLQRPLEIAVDVPVAWLGFQVFAVLLTHVARSEAHGRVDLIERNLQLLATRQMLAERTRSEERLRLARDLHDGLGHHLTALSLNLEAAAHGAGDDARPHVVRAQRVTRALLDDVRATVKGMRDEPVEPMPAIRALAQSLDEPVIHVTGPDRLGLADSERSDALLRVVQEIITNALRHGQAQNVWITLREHEGRLDLEGRDDGVGAADWRAGGGLTGMRERITRLGGSLDLRSAPGRGFEVFASLPLTERAA